MHEDALAMTTKSRTTKIQGPLTVLIAGLAVLSGLSATPVLAQAGPTNLGSFSSWTAWQGADASGPTCYISSVPEKSEPAGANRDPIHFMVIHRTVQKVRNEVQTLIGYPFKPDSTPTASVDGKVYPMVFDGQAAWLASSGDEGNFVAAMKGGSSLVIKGTSQRGTNTTDTYSLAGVTAAITEIDKACP